MKTVLIAIWCQLWMCLMDMAPDGPCLNAVVWMAERVTPNDF